MRFLRYDSTTFVGEHPSTTNKVFSAFGGPAGDSCGYKRIYQPAWSNMISSVPAKVIVDHVDKVRSGLPPHFNVWGGEVVDPFTFDVASFAKTDKSMTAVQYREARENGTIVLKGMEKYECAATLVPGGHPSDPALPAYYKSFALPRDVVFTDTSPCGSSPRVLNTAMNGYPLDNPFITNDAGAYAGSVQLNYSVFEIDSLQLPPSDVAYEAWSNILDQIKTLEWDRGLITAVTAEANSGAMDVLTEIGEARETVGFIFGLIGRILDLAVAFRKLLSNLIRKNAGKATKAFATELATLWMEFRYAVSPIGYSINDALALMTSLHKPYGSFRSGSSQKIDVELSDGWSASGNLEIIDRVFLKHRYELESRLDGMKFNPLATAWELTPLSFVIDWALNIGDLLSALWLPNNVSQVAAQYSRQLRPSTVVLTQKGKATGNVLLNCRYYKATPFDPLAEVRLNVNLSMSTKRWADAVSLSWLLTKDKLKR